MGTPYPSDQERQAIKRRADAGDQSAKNYLDLLDVCTAVLQGSDGISLARGMLGEHNDVYGEAIDDALSELMPVILKVAAAGWESLKFYVPPEDYSGRRGEALMAELYYCVKCKKKTEIKDAQAVTMKNGKPALKGQCTVCGTTVNAILSTKKAV